MRSRCSWWAPRAATCSSSTPPARVSSSGGSCPPRRVCSGRARTLVAFGTFAGKRPPQPEGRPASTRGPSRPRHGAGRPARPRSHALAVHMAITGVKDIEYRIVCACRDGNVHTIKESGPSGVVIELESMPCGLVRLDKYILVGCMSNAEANLHASWHGQHEVGSFWQRIVPGQHVVHARTSAACGQAAPPKRGTANVRERVCVPLPHDTVQLPHAAHECATQSCGQARALHDRVSAR